MTHPQKVSRKAFETFAGTRWNAMVNICALSNIRDLNPVQRVAHLAFWYMSEVYNGGHYQYLVNRFEFNNLEVVKALQTIGAVEQASILDDVLNKIEMKPIGMPQNVEEFLSGEKKASLSELDTRFYNCQRSIEICLEDYLGKHEHDFIEWIA